MDSEEIIDGAVFEDDYMDDEIDEADEEEPTLTFKIDHGRIRGKTDELDAMKQAVDKILRTERFVYPIYDEEYGNDLKDLIGKPMAYAESEVKRMIVDALEADDRVTDVTIDNIKEVNRDALQVIGVCLTVFGSIPIESEVTVGNDTR